MSIDQKLHELGIVLPTPAAPIANYVPAVVSGNTTAHKKPHADMLMFAADRWQASISEVLMIGDSPIDLQPARAAGTRVCLVRYGFGFSFSADDFRGDERFADAPADIAAALD